MAFRLKPRGAIAAQLRRLVRDELEEATEHLRGSEPRDEAIHDARTAIKKVRALLRLLRDPLASRYQAENDRLGDAGRLLSALRDADALDETMRSLHGQYAAVVTGPITARVRRGLRRRARSVGASGPARLRAAGRAVEQATESLPEHIRRIAGFRAVRVGAAHGYRQAQRALAGLTVDADVERLHRWRRRVKDHWYHVRLFERLHRGAATRAQRLDRLESWLGDDHNLTLLRTTLLHGAERFGDARTVAIVLGCIVKYQASLRDRALKLGQRLFKPDPDEFEKTIVVWWRARDAPHRK